MRGEEELYVERPGGRRIKVKPRLVNCHPERLPYN